MNATQSCRVITSPSCRDKRHVIPLVFLCRTFIPVSVWLLSLFAWQCFPVWEWMCVFMLSWLELNPWWSLIPSRGVSLCHDHRESERERGRRMLCDGKEVVKWTTAVAIETLLATQHCCYPACLSDNFRPVVSMNISVGSHFPGTPCAYNKLYILYWRGKKKMYLTARRYWNSPLSSQIKASAWERLRLIRQKSHLFFGANEIWNAFCHFVFIILLL